MKRLSSIVAYLLLLVGFLYVNVIPVRASFPTSDDVGPQPTLDGPNPHNQATLAVTIDFGDSDRAILSAEIGDPAKVAITGGTITDRVPQNSPADTVWLVTIDRAGGNSDVTVDVKAGWYQDAATNDNVAVAETFVFFYNLFLPLIMR